MFGQKKVVASFTFLSKMCIQKFEGFEVFTGHTLLLLMLSHSFLKPGFDVLKTELILYQGFFICGHFT